MDIKEKIHATTEELLSNMERLVAIDSQLGRPAEGIGVDGTVSVRNYLKCELYTYSAKTLALFILSIEKNPEYNRYLATMQKMVQAYGYSSLEEAEKEMA